MAKKKRKASFTGAILQRKPRAAKKQLREIKRSSPGAYKAISTQYRRKHGKIL